MKGCTKEKSRRASVDVFGNNQETNYQPSDFRKLLKKHWKSKRTKKRILKEWRTKIPNPKLNQIIKEVRLQMAG